MPRRSGFHGAVVSVGRAPALQAGGREFKSLRFHYVGMAQLEEQLVCNQQVSGSSPDDVLRVKLERFHGGLISREHGFKSHTRDFIAP